MSDNEKIDYLSRDAAEALKRGMTYGKYMQWKSMNQGEILQPVRQTAGEGEVVCRTCGKVFKRSQHYRVYCSKKCNSDYYHMREKARRLRGGFGT